MSKRGNASGAAKCAAWAAACVVSMLGIGTVHAADGGTDACGLLDAPDKDFAMRIPFDVIDGRIYVQAKVNDRGPFRFAVDTGASGMGRADASLVSALGLAIQRPTANSDGIEVAEADTTTLDSLDIGGLSRGNLQVITRDYNSRMSPEAALAGIVGRGFFEDGLLVIDYPGKTISFSRKLSLSPSHGGALAYERPFRVPVSIAGVHTEGNLDTGANVAFVLPQSLFDRIGGTPLQQAGHGRLSNSRIETGRSTIHGPFRIGQATLEDREVRVSESYPEVLVGAYALQSFAILIDQRSKRVAVCP